jgi:hypothetical protein
MRWLISASKLHSGYERLPAVEVPDVSAGIGRERANRG